MWSNFQPLLSRYHGRLQNTDHTTALYYAPISAPTADFTCNWCYSVATIASFSFRQSTCPSQRGICSRHEMRTFAWEACVVWYFKIYSQMNLGECCCRTIFRPQYLYIIARSLTIKLTCLLTCKMFCSTCPCTLFHLVEHAIFRKEMILMRHWNNF